MGLNMKYYIQLVLILVLTILVMGVIAPMLISAKDTLQVIFGFLLVIVWVSFGVYLGTYYLKKLLKLVPDTTKEE